MKRRFARRPIYLPTLNGDPGRWTWLRMVNFFKLAGVWVPWEHMQSK